jgi:hypothetical protein
MVLQTYNDTVITLSCLYVEFIFQQEVGWCNWIAKAKKHLKRNGASLQSSVNNDSVLIKHCMKKTNQMKNNIITLNPFVIFGSQ